MEHSSLTIVKINGDYIDCRFRNTTEELDAYPPKLHEFSHRIFSESGLITCGSETSGSIRNILGYDLKAVGTSAVLRLKSAIAMRLFHYKTHLG